MIVNVLLGGGLIVTFVTLKSIKKQAAANASQAEATAKNTEAQADSSEIDNVDKVAKMWREYAETSEARYQTTIAKMGEEMAGMRAKIETMEETIRMLTVTNRKILKILKDINHENLEQKRQEAKQLAED
jgi:hypothetical protein